MRRSPFKALLLAATFVQAFAALACTSSSSTTSLDPPHLTASITAVGLGSGAPGSHQCDQVAAVAVGPNDGAGHLLSPSKPPVSWTISPPQTCIGTPPCGYLELTVSPCTSADPTTCSNAPMDQQIIVSAGPSITVTVANFSPDAGTPFDRFYRFRVDLFNQNATPAVDRDGKTWPAVLVYEMKAPCEAPAPPGPDAAPMRDASMDVSVPPMDGARPPTDATTPPPRDATTHMDASRDSAPPPDALPPAPDATRPHDAGRLPDAHTP